MEVLDVGVAGTMESSDIMVTIKKNEDAGIKIELASSVEKQFGDHIKQVIKESLEKKDVKRAHVSVVDKGALDCVIKARVFTAIHRACKNEDYNWEV